MSLKSDALKKCALFQGCSDADVKLVWQQATITSVKQGDPVFVINDPSRFVYIVLNGSVHIVGQGGVKNQFPKMRTVNRFEHFGELSVLAADRHRTSAFAAENSELLCIAASYFLELIRRVDRVNRNQCDTLIQYYFNSIRHQFRLPFLNDASECRFDKRFAKVAPLKLAVGRKAIPIRLETDVLTIGFCLPLSSAQIESIRAQYPAYRIKLALLEEPLYETLRKSYLNFLSGQAFAASAPAAVKSQSEGAVADDLEDLRMSTLLLSQLPADTFQKIAPFFQVLDVAEGDVIFSPSRPSDRLYFISSGEVKLDKDIPGLGVQVNYRTAEQYDAFFDASLFNAGENRITAIASSRCRVFSIGKDVYQELSRYGEFAVPFSITMAQVVQGLNKAQSGLEYFAGYHTAGDSHSQHLLPRAKIVNSKILPLEVIGKDLTLGVVVPRQEVLDDAVDSYLRAYNVKMCLITEENFNAWIAETEDKALPEDTVAIYKNSGDDNRLLKPVNVDPTVALEQILVGAIENRASDIHFEPSEKFLVARYRIDGVIMQLWNHMPLAVGQNIVRRVKVLAEMDISETRLPQDGQFAFKKGDFESSFRVSSVPTRFGEKIVLRTTGKKNSVIPLQLLAPDTKITKFFNRLVKYQQGIFFITGPTGSGKSTSLYSILSELNKPDRNIITIEDPIEANIVGINQIEIDPSIGLTHESILRNVLRQDPDVIMVGEIRDSVSMQLALDAALSGQLVLTTIHAGNTFEVIPRLKELGATTSHIASGLIGVMSQRLVRCLCTSCKKPRAVTAKEVELFKEMEFTEPVIQVMDAVGCSKCNFTGFSGQIPVFEFWEKTVHVHNALMDEAKSEEIANAIKKSNVESLASYGLKMVAQGLTTVSEVNDVLFGIADLMAS